MRNIRTLSRVFAAAAILLAACDTSVTNPGPIPDENLNDPLAYPSLVIGSRLALARSYGSDAANGGQLAYWGAAVAFEIIPAGSTGSFGIPTVVQTGVLNPTIADDDWESANQARFTAEDVLRRFAEVGARDTLKRARPNQIAEVALYAGYSNRALGENFCGAVLPLTNPDGSLSPGDSTPHTDYFLRAEQHFTNTIAQSLLATGTDTVRAATLRTAAYAGRASVRLDLASWGVTSPGVATAAAMWDSAAVDAGRVTSNTFVFQLPYSTQEQTQYNYLYWSSADQPYRAHTQWGTFLEGYYRASRALALANPLTYKADVRARWDTAGLTGDAAVARFGGRVSWWPQRKHASESAPINLSSGWEMRLVEAERALVAGDALTAVNTLNLRRTDLSLPTYDNTVSVDSAWTLLKLERGIELWLEARRLGDLRRWIVNGVPGNLYDGLYRASRTGPYLATPVETMTAPVARSLCFPIAQSERDTNPNL
jgi:hypothetical protein